MGCDPMALLRLPPLRLPPLRLPPLRLPPLRLPPSPPFPSPFQKTLTLMYFFGFFFTSATSARSSRTRESLCW